MVSKTSKKGGQSSSITNNGHGAPLKLLRELGFRKTQSHEVRNELLATLTMRQLDRMKMMLVRKHGYSFSPSTEKGIMANDPEAFLEAIQLILH